MKNKLILFIGLVLPGLVAILLVSRLNPFLAPLIYWWVLGLCIITVWFFKLSSSPVLLSSFGLFIFAAILTTIRITNLAEIIMRLSLIGWLVGFTQAVLEYFSKKT